MELAGSKTEQNLRAAFSGESEARNKYTFFASVARQEGYEEIADIFEKTADNERAHAKIWFNELKGIGTTLQNLKNASDSENYEWTDMYARFAEEAEKEGFTAIAEKFRLVGAIEKEHETRFNEYIKNVENKTVFEKDGQVIWICRNCGHIHVSDKAPLNCVVCNHPQSYFEVKK